LELLSVESDLLDNISFMDIIDTFASAKAESASKTCRISV
jgi:hypothetical protein